MMFRDYKITIGIAPTRRDKFPNPKEALKNKQRIMPKLKEMLGNIHDVKIVDIDWLNEEGMLFDKPTSPKSRPISDKPELMQCSCLTAISARKKWSVNWGKL